MKVLKNILHEKGFQRNLSGVIILHLEILRNNNKKGHIITWLDLRNFF